MPDSGFFLGDNDVRLLQSIMQRLEEVEAQTAQRMMPGMAIPYMAPARSSKYSDSHLEAIDDNWTHHYQLNEINTEGIAGDRSGDPAFNGLLKADSATALPQQGQPGGLVSDGSYSYYFPGKEKSRIEVPLLSELTTNFFFECMVKPEALGQFADIFYNGTVGTNGWGVAMTNAAGTGAGNLLIAKTSTGGIYNTGYEFKANCWHWIGISYIGTSFAIALVKLDPITKVVTPLGGTVTVSSIVKPTGAACIGNGKAGGATPFKGWIDNVLVYNGTIALGEEPKNWGDRYHTAVEAAAPPGFVLADGTAVSRAKYDSLFKAIGTIHGVGDGSTTFNLPNLNNKVLIGKESEALGASLSKQFGTAGTVFSLLNTNFLVKV